MTTAAVAVREVARRLAARGVASPQADAELLVAHALGVPRARLALSDAPPPEALEPLVVRRERREPLQHITGRAAFRRIEVQVGPGVFVPRPETELLVDAALARVAAPRLGVDLCAGSGALALALADEVPGCEVHAVEVDLIAFAWLARNVLAPVVAHRTAVAGCLPELEGTVDVVLANPPYLPVDARLDLEAGQDPRRALFGGGPDALQQVSECIEAAGRLLRPGGVLAVEHDSTQAGQVPALFGDGWAEVTGVRDLTGRPRLTVASRAAGARSSP